MVRNMERGRRQAAGWLAERWHAMGQGVAAAHRAADATLAAAVAAVALVLTFGLGLIVAWPPAVERLRRAAGAERLRLGRRTGSPIPSPYAPLPAEGEAGDSGCGWPAAWRGPRYRKGERTFRRHLTDPAIRRDLEGSGCGWPAAWHGPRYRKLERTFQRYLTDPATWRDLHWAVLSPALALLALLPAAAVAYGALGLLLPGVLGDPHGASEWLGSFLGARASGIGFGLLSVGLGLWAAPPLLRLHDRVSEALLRPTGKAVLALRVRELSETRTEAVDAQAAELRRIERDLHDGVQARLIAVGLNLGAIEQLTESDPAAARMMAAQARESSERALAELRGLVRGIHPPVLAERGLVDAVRAVAVDSPLDAEVTADLAGEVPAALQSAVYFAVCELLANAARHAGAERAWIDLHTAETGTPREALRVSVTDDGHGGAELTDGGGLRGVERRLAAFDGVLALSSPHGGPTMLTLEIPCALSSPRTSTSSEKA
ncbi:histidine kinase [Streptomyces sp. S07_1.15]|uniref:sensor histidine kinase n=1 Tax=Streptomyces sp. S07_1.15 TaxID=2873925 RepID=UPI001D1350B1|nr:histidine kinase [Streptomyces sp. S07_1.15]MCC3654076.1 histidine kinase [Streptomyces sp. S07_1.15]